MARPLVAGPRPRCPDGHPGRVHLDGVRARRDGLYSRPLYRCLPSAPGSTRHRFTETREHRTEQHPAGVTCHECEVRPGRTEGAFVAWNWNFAARQIAEAMLLVGRGLSYRKTAAQLRTNESRFVRDATGIPSISRDGGTVARYLDALAPIVIESVAHREWPKILLLDALPVRGRVLDDDGYKQPSEAKGAFLVACGYTEPIVRRRRRQKGDPSDAPTHRTGRTPHLWHAEVSGGLDRLSWREFLDQLDGEPEWVVTDGDPAVKAAVIEKWGGRPVLYSCEGHIWRNFEAAARADGISPHQAETIFGDALHDEETWREFLGRLLALPDGTINRIASWLAHWDETVRIQMSQRRRGHPRGIGAMEAAIEQLDDWIGDRRKVFQNVRRINIVLALMRAQIAGHADAPAYTRIVRDAIAAVGGRPAINWRAHHDRGGHRGLFALVDAASARRDAGQPAYNVEAKNRSMRIKIALANAYRATLGYPPLTVRETSSTISVVVKGQMLSDRPEIAREWDQANAGAPLIVRAGSTRAVSWVCALNSSHVWSAPVDQRCARLTGCPTHARISQNQQRGRRTALPVLGWSDLTDDLSDQPF